MQVDRKHFEGDQNLNFGQRKNDDQILAGLLPFRLTSVASAGGSVTETLIVTGLKITDEIMSISQRVKGAGTIGTTPHSVAVVGWTNQAADALDIEWVADPGAGAIVEIMVRRPTV